MDFVLNEEQTMLRESLARLLRDDYGFEHREAASASALGFSADLWGQLAALGLCALPFAEADGGLGAGSAEIAVVMSELGRALALEPYLESVVLGGGLLSQLGSPALRERWLPALASGECRIAVALDEEGSDYRPEAVTTRAQRSDLGWHLSGRKVAVIGGHAADLLLVSARLSDEPSAIGLFLVEPRASGLQRRDYATYDGRHACDLLLDQVLLSDDACLGAGRDLLAALEYQLGRARAAQCADMLGSMQATCELTLEYLKTRRQFGKAIGEFQVLQHRMVDMRVELEMASSLVWLAAQVADGEPGEERERALAAAQFVCCRAARTIAEQAIQLHGGIGLTWEYALAHHAKRLVMASHQFGDDDYHLRAFMALLD